MDTSSNPDSSEPREADWHRTYREDLIRRWREEDEEGTPEVPEDEERRAQLLLHTRGGLIRDIARQLDLARKTADALRRPFPAQLKVLLTGGQILAFPEARPGRSVWPELLLTLPQDPLSGREGDGRLCVGLGRQNDGQGRLRLVYLARVPETPVRPTRRLNEITLGSVIGEVHRATRQARQDASIGQVLTSGQVWPQVMQLDTALPEADPGYPDLAELISLGYLPVSHGNLGTLLYPPVQPARTPLQVFISPLLRTTTSASELAVYGLPFAGALTLTAAHGPSLALKLLGDLGMVVATGAIGYGSGVLRRRARIRREIAGRLLNAGFLPEVHPVALGEGFPHRAAPTPGEPVHGAQNPGRPPVPTSRLERLGAEADNLTRNLLALPDPVSTEQAGRLQRLTQSVQERAAQGFTPDSEEAFADLQTRANRQAQDTLGERQRQLDDRRLLEQLEHLTEAPPDRGF